MKFGILKYSSRGMNLGDYAQLEGIRQAYKRMHIDKNDIVEIERNKITEYDGDYVVLPMAGFFSTVRTIHLFPWPSKIIPVYLGFHCVDESLIEEVYKAHRNWGPFGCRDLSTMNLMRRNGLNAYMSGCMSICYEKREEIPSTEKVFLYDPPEELVDYIPKELLENSEIIEPPTREMKYQGYKEENGHEAKAILDDIFQKLKKEATLVVTKRLHVALPCIAMGIQVVLAHICHNGDLYDNRFSGLDRIIKPYKLSEFGAINWQPEPIDIEWLKEYTINLAVQKISETYNKWNSICTLSNFYENTKPAVYYDGMKASYISDFQKKIEMNNTLREHTIFEEVVNHKFENMHLVFWGAGDKAQWALRRYFRYILKCKNFTIVDSDCNKIGKKTNECFKGVKDWNANRVSDFIIESTDCIEKISKNELVIIITANHYYEGAGAAIGNLLTERYGFRDGKEFFFLDKLNNSLELPLSESVKLFNHLDGF